MAFTKLLTEWKDKLEEKKKTICTEIQAISTLEVYSKVTVAHTYGLWFQQSPCTCSIIQI